MGARPDLRRGRGSCSEVVNASLAPVTGCYGALRKAAEPPGATRNRNRESAMIVRHFPRPCPPVGWLNLVIHARGRGVEYAEHEAPLSIKCVVRGREVHEVRGIPYVVDEDTYLLLNHGQRYSSRIDPGRHTETSRFSSSRSSPSRCFEAWSSRQIIALITTILASPQALPAQPLIGDAVPALGDQVTWLHGAASPEFEVGRVHLLDFWATWCPPRPA